MKYQEFKEFRIIDGVLRPIYLDLRTRKEKYLVSNIRKIKDKKTKEETEILVSMNWEHVVDSLKPAPIHIAKELQHSYDMNWLEKRLFEAERKLSKIEKVLGKEKFEEVLGIC